MPQKAFDRSNYDYDHECLILILDELLHHTLDHSEALVSLTISHVHASLALVVLDT